MKKSVFIALVTSSLVVLSGVRGSALTLWDIDVFFKPKYLYTDCFDITSKYSPAWETVTYAKAWFLLSDDELWDSRESVAVYLADQPFLGPASATPNLLSDKLSGGAFETLDTTGKLNYTFRGTEGDFFVWGAKMLVETSPRAVPDGGATLMLLGVALAGIESLRPRITRRNLQQKRA